MLNQYYIQSLDSDNKNAKNRLCISMRIPRHCRQTNNPIIPGRLHKPTRFRLDQWILDSKRPTMWQTHNYRIQRRLVYHGHPYPAKKQRQKQSNF